MTLATITRRTKRRQASRKHRQGRVKASRRFEEPQQAGGKLRSAPCSPWAHDAFRMACSTALGHAAMRNFPAGYK